MLATVDIANIRRNLTSLRSNQLTCIGDFDRQQSTARCSRRRRSRSRLGDGERCNRDHERNAVRAGGVFNAASCADRMSIIRLLGKRHAEFVPAAVARWGPDDFVVRL